MSSTSSSQRFVEYRRKVQARNRGDSPADEDDDKKDKKPRSRNFNQLFREFLNLLAGHRSAIVFALGTLTIATLLGLVPPLATKLVIDNILTQKPLPAWSSQWGLPADRYQLLYLVGAFVVGVSLVATAISLSGRYLATKTVQRLHASIRRQVFAHAVRLPLHRVYQLKSGGAASLLRDDAGGISELVFSMLYNPWRAVIQLIGSLLVLTWVDWRMTLGGLALLPAVYLTHRTWISRIRPLYRDIRNLRQGIDGSTTEAFGGIRIVRTYGRERSETQRYVTNNHLMARQQLFVWWWTRVIELIWDLIIPLASISLLIYGGSQVLQGRLTIGDVTMFLVYLTMLLGPLEVLANSATTFQNNLAGLDRVLDLLKEPLETEHTPPTTSLKAEAVRGAIEFRDVTFQYPTAPHAALEEVNLQIEPGTVVALVGRSGAGKTTMCNLVARFYDPTRGCILLDGVDLRELPVEDYRGLLGIVEQDVFLFDGTIGDNIGYAARSASPEEIHAAAVAANADEFIRDLEKGYDTLIGERGVRLSGGQRQRLAIARALLANPRLLILDEATSNLDTESERLIHQSLERLMRGRTSLVIAHRLSTIARADKIVVLDGGRIAETGTHAELMARSGRYRQMVESQLTPDAPSHSTAVPLPVNPSPHFA
ncbi:ABC transporter ATP-binding protein [Anatilimnocola floriformis]|uniref:ABC transporter ATP-binding protein n=1 Tax=Anatilimnocola floriformis TaxID=2948575 RepID=UPI0020C20850|nr:ABC transporter ATP-binding protein [Anatilimnocola floriformis]